MTAPAPSRTAAAQTAVERAMAELRRGGIVVLRGNDGSGGLVIAADPAARAPCSACRGWPRKRRCW